MSLPIYFINLDRSAERRAFMEAQFSRLGLNAIRVAAATPDQVDQKHFAKYLGDNRLSSGGIACAMSHQKAAAALLETDCPFAVIFEDDAVLSSSLPAFLEAFANRAPTLDLVRLETSMGGLRFKSIAAARLANVDLSRPYSWEAGAAGYIISRRAAVVAAKSDMMCIAGPDVALFQPFGPLARLSRAQATPALCIQAHLRQTVQFAREIVSDPPRRLSLWERVTGYLRNFIEREVTFGLPRLVHQIAGAKKRVVPFLAD